MSNFGLIGKNIGYSFSKNFFSEKFEKENLPHSYENYDMASLNSLQKIIQNTPNLLGLNVTIPFKEAIIPFLDFIAEDARQIGAVNTLKISDGNILKGYNTDHYGFQQALQPFLPLQKKSALILGTGGASKAVAFSLKHLGFTYEFVSRNKTSAPLTYSRLDQKIIQNNTLIVNCTPVGTYPKIEEFPAIPYQFLTKNHLLFDLIYNPIETEFLKRGKIQGSKTTNGLEMLKLQAEKAWEIWNS